MPMVRVSNGGTKAAQPGYMYGIADSGALISGYKSISYVAPVCCNAVVFCKGFNLLTGNLGVASGINEDGSTTELGNFAQLGTINVSNYDIVIVWGQIGNLTVNYSLS